MHCGNIRPRQLFSDSPLWSLRLTGQVDKPLNLSMVDLHSLPFVEMSVATACVGSSARHPRIKQATWLGVRLSALFSEARADPDATYAQFSSADGYITNLPVVLLTNALVAYAVDGQELGLKQGFPLRLVVAGVYGYKMPKWIKQIELTRTPVPGPLEAQGWSALGQVQTMSHIFTPHHKQVINGMVRLSGVAFTGQRAIEQIEVSIDDADWMPVNFTPPPPGSWTLWQAEWLPPAPGDYVIRVRATDSGGFTQTDTPSSSVFPNGSSTIHSIVVRITSSLEVAHS